eukprot:s126_g17.t1
MKGLGAPLRCAGCASAYLVQNEGQPVQLLEARCAPQVRQLQFREFWMDDHFCDIVLQSSDDAELRAHAAVLSAASKNFKNLLGGCFLEADRVQRGQPVKIAASKEAVHGLLDYVYGGQPEVNLKAGLELLRLAEAYDLPKLASAIETSFRASLDISSALQILQEAHGLHALKAACEEKVAEDFETCSQHPEFGKLDAIQLARIVNREDLVVSREEVVLKGIFNWLKISKDRDGSLGMLLELVDFQSMSVENLLRLGCLLVPGLNSDHLHRKVKDGLQAPCRKRTQRPPRFRPKRRCLRHWSPDLGASTEAPGQQVLPTPCFRLCWHEGSIYALDFSNEVFCWKPGEPATQVRQLVGEGTRVTGINDLGTDRYFRDLSISPSGEILVADGGKGLVSLHNGFGRILLDGLCKDDKICCSPNGKLYVLTAEALQKLEGSRLQTVMNPKSLPEDLQFKATAMFVTKGEVIYILDHKNDRILRLNPAESFKPVLVGQVPAEHEPNLWDLFVTDGETIYVADYYQRKVLAIRPGDATFTEVLECPDELRPTAVLVQDGSLYVSMQDEDDCRGGGLYEYVGLPHLDLGDLELQVLEVVQKLMQLMGVAFNQSVPKILDGYVSHRGRAVVNEMLQTSLSQSLACPASNFSSGELRAIDVPAGWTSVLLLAVTMVFLVVYLAWLLQLRKQDERPVGHPEALEHGFLPQAGLLQ